MSWSVSIIGKPENVAAALDAEGEKLSGASREEFDAAKPALQQLVRLNFSSDGVQAPVVTLRASGSGWHVDGKQQSGSVGVTLSASYDTLV